MAAMEACLAARRIVAAPEPPKTAAELMAEQMKAASQAPPQTGSTGPAAGNGFEILLQVGSTGWDINQRRASLAKTWCLERNTYVCVHFSCVVNAVLQ